MLNGNKRYLFRKYCKGNDPAMEAMMAALPASAPPIGELVADEPFWRYPLGATAGEGIAHLRVWRTASSEPGPSGRRHGDWLRGLVAGSAPHIWVVPARRYGPLHRAARASHGTGDGEGTQTHDLDRIGAYGGLHWLR